MFLLQKSLAQATPPRLHKKLFHLKHAQVLSFSSRDLAAVLRSKIALHPIFEATDVRTPFFLPVLDTALTFARLPNRFSNLEVLEPQEVDRAPHSFYPFTFPQIRTRCRPIHRNIIDNITRL